MSNILDEIHRHALATNEAIHDIAKAVAKLHAAITAPKPEWEPLPIAMARRKKARRTLLAAVKAGDVLARMEKGPGADAYLLRIVDLDKHFPVRA